MHRRLGNSRSSVLVLPLVLVFSLLAIVYIQIENGDIGERAQLFSSDEGGTALSGSRENAEGETSGPHRALGSHKLISRQLINEEPAAKNVRKVFSISSRLVTKFPRFTRSSDLIINLSAHRISCLSADGEVWELCPSCAEASRGNRRPACFQGNCGRRTARFSRGGRLAQAARVTGLQHCGEDPTGEERSRLSQPDTSSVTYRLIGLLGDGAT